jgi:hypothetical protein
MSNTIARWIDLSQPEHTPAGSLLYRMWYGSFIEKTLLREERYGYPHNGGQHTLSVKLTKPDFDAFVALVAQTFSEHNGTLEFVNYASRAAHCVFDHR